MRGVIALLFATAVIVSVLTPADSQAISPSYSRYQGSWFSEEGQATDGRNGLMYALSCSGSYCDNTLEWYVDVNIGGNNPTFNNWYGSGWFSEESPNAKICPNVASNTLAIQHQCSGPYCDNMFITCSTPTWPNVETPSVVNCGWLGIRYLSEESPNNGASCGNKYLAGISCFGPYCDNKDIYCCDLQFNGCKGGYYGSNCLRCPNCVNGYCRDKGGDGGCTCYSTWQGSLCDQRIPPTVRNVRVSYDSNLALSCPYDFSASSSSTDKSIIDWVNSANSVISYPTAPFTPKMQIACRVLAGDPNVMSTTYVTSPPVILGGYFDHQLDYGDSFSTAFERTYNNQLMLWLGDPVPWTEADRRCKDQGGFLLTITGTELLTDASTLLTSESLTDIWIGLSFNGGVGSWTSGSPYTFTNGLATPSTASCVRMRSDKSWIAGPCTDNYKFLCARSNLPQTKYVEAYAVLHAPVRQADAAAQCSRIYNGPLSTILSRNKDLARLQRFASLFNGAQCSQFWTGLTYTNGVWQWPGGRRPYDSIFSSNPLSPLNGDTLLITSSSAISANPSTLACPICDAAVITVTPGISTLTLTLNGLWDYKYTVEIAEKTTNSYSVITSKDLTRDLPGKAFTQQNLRPGITYFVRIVNPSLTTIIWDKATAVKTYCDCELNSARHGTPTNFDIYQQKDKNLFRYRDNSACDTITTIVEKTSGDTFKFAHTEAQQCPDTTTTSYPNALYHSILGAPVGKVLKYCITVSNPDKFYTTPEVCKDKQIEFIGLISGQIKTRSGDYVTGVNVTWAVEGGTLAGWALVDSTGAFNIEFQTATITKPNQNILITPLKRTGSIQHRYEFADPCASGTCFKDNRDTTGIITLSQLVTYNLKLLDLTVFSITGKIVFADSGQYATDRKDCPVEKALICSTAVGVKTCVNSSLDGSFTLTAPVQVDAIIEASYKVQDVSYTVKVYPNYCTQGTVATLNSGTLATCTLKMITDYEVYFQVTSFAPAWVTVYGGNPECKHPIGNGVVLVKALRGCAYSRTFNTDKASRLTLTLPPMDFEVSLQDIASPIVSPSEKNNALAYLRQTLGSDTASQRIYLSQSPNAELFWEYHSPATVSFVAIGPSPRCGPNFVVQGSPRIISTSIRAKAFETYADKTCYVSGSAVFWDSLIDPIVAKQFPGYEDCLPQNAGCKVNFTVDSGNYRESYINIKTVPGTPNIFSPYTKRVRLLVSRPAIFDVITDENVIITGQTSTGNIQSTELALSTPMLILYRPPGDMSKAWITKGTTFSSAVSVSSSIGGGSGMEMESVIGASFEAETCAGIGVEACTKIGSFKGGLAVSASASYMLENRATVDLSFSTSLETTLTTTESPGFPSGDGDVVLVNSISFQRSELQELSMNLTTCKVILKKIYSWKPEQSGTTVRTIYQIRNFDIPQINDTIQEIIKQGPPSDPAKKDDYLYRLTTHQQGLSNWEAILDYHEDSITPGSTKLIPLNQYNQLKCVDGSGKGYCNTPSENFNFTNPLNSKLFFTGGGQTYEMVSSFENSLLKSAGQTSSSEAQFGAGLASETEAMSFYLLLNFKALGTVTSSSESNKEVGKVTTTTVGFTLGDSNIADKFNVEIMVNKDFGTPVFLLMNGISSCPHEPGTIPLDGPSIKADMTSISNIPPDQEAVFTIKVGSYPEVDYGERTYRLKVNENSAGARLSLSGSPFNAPRDISLPWGMEKSLTLTVGRGPIEYVYDDIELSLVSACEDDLDEMYEDPITSTVTLTVEFLQPCAPFVWSSFWALDSPEYFRINAASVANNNQFIEVVITNPNYPNLPWAENKRYKQVVIEYKHVSQNLWTQAAINKKNDPAFLEEADFGIAVTLIDASSWYFDGLYEIRVRTICTAVAGASSEYNGYTGQSKLGRVDRILPKLLGNFAEPNNGVFTPGDEISASFAELINCDLAAYPFQGVITILRPGDTSPRAYSTQDHPDHIQAFCLDNVIQLQFGKRLQYNDIKGAKVKVFLNGVEDLAGNPSSDLITWSFTVRADVTSDYLSLTFSTLPTNSKLLDYVRLAEKAQKRDILDVESVFQKLEANDELFKKAFQNITQPDEVDDVFVQLIERPSEEKIVLKVTVKLGPKVKSDLTELVENARKEMSKMQLTLDDVNVFSK